VLEHISEEALQKYQQRSLSAAEVLSVCDHLESCPQCRERLAARVSLNQLHNAFEAELKAAPDQLTAHLLPDEIVAYVESELAEVELEIADGHLLFCLTCSADIQDLRQFKASLQRPPMKAGPIEKKTDFWQRALRFWRQPAWGLALQAATLALLVFFFISSRSLKNQVSDLQGRLITLGEANDRLQQQVETLPTLQYLNNEVTSLQRGLGTLRQTNDQLQQQVNTIPALLAQIARLDVKDILRVNHTTNTEPLSDNGRQIAVVQGSLKGLEDLSPDLQQLISNTLSQQEIIKKPLIPNEIIPKKDQTMSPTADREKFHWLLTPKGKIIESDRPTLSWHELAGATSYSVAVYDANSKLVAKSPELSATNWTLPEPLERGQIYIWEVTAIKEGIPVIAPSPPAPQAKFKILEQRRYQELLKIKRHSDSHLLQGTMYAQFGLLDEAEREFNALLRENPNSRLAKKLLNSVIGLRPKQP
jgi:hypothetical protein